MPWEKTEDYIRSGHRDTGGFDKDSLRTIDIDKDGGIKAVIGCPSGKYESGRCSVGMEVQSYLFDASKWDMDRAKEWFKKHSEKDSMEEGQGKGERRNGMPKDLSYEAKRGLLMNALDPGKEYKVWVKDIYGDRVIVEDCGKLFEMPYIISEGKATLGEKKEVVISYDPLAEMKDVEVLKAGTFTSMTGEAVTYTGDDLEEIEKNARELGEILKPPLVATHDEGEDASVAVFGSVHGGILHNIRKVGEKLLADIKGVPKKAADLLGETGEFRLSPEIYKDFKHEGESHGKALRRVAWVAIPAIKTMAGITPANLFGERPDQPTTWVRLHEPGPGKKGKEKGMEITKMQEQMTKLSEKVTALEGENKTLKADRENALTKLSEREKAEKSSKVKEMVKPFREAGLAPAAAEGLEAFAESLEGAKVQKFGEKEAIQLDRFAEVLNSLFKRAKDGKLIVQFGEVAPGTKKEQGKEGERDEAVRKYQEANKCDLKTAVIAVGRQRPELFKD